MLTKLILTLILFMLSSCAQLKVNRNDTPNDGSAISEVRLKSFLFGFVPGKKNSTS